MSPAGAQDGAEASGGDLCREAPAGGEAGGHPSAAGKAGGTASGGWWVYLVRCRDGSLYAGCTNDLTRRLQAHNAGRGAAYTRSRGPVELAWWELQPGRSAALRREWAIKQLTRRQKLALVAAGGVHDSPAT